MSATRRRQTGIARSLATGILLVFGALHVVGCGHPAPSRSSMAEDAITIHVRSKPWGGESSIQCMIDDWGWNSVSWKAHTGDIFTSMIRPGRLDLRVGRIVGPDSVWLFNGSLSTVLRYDAEPRSDFAPGDSVLLTHDLLRFTTPSVDAGTYVEVRLADGPDRPSPPGRTAELAGTVRDSTTGKPLDHARVFLLGSRFVTSTNARGEFILKEVPVGIVRIAVCREACYLRKTVALDAPAPPLDLELRRNPQCRFPDD